MEITREKNVATKIMFPLIDSVLRPEYRTGALTGVVVTAYSWSDSQTSALLAIADTPTHKTVGLWELSLTQGEMNPDTGADDYIIIKINANEIDEQAILIKLQDYNDKESLLSIDFMPAGDSETVQEFFRNLNWAQARPRKGADVTTDWWEYIFKKDADPEATALGDAVMRRKIFTKVGFKPVVEDGAINSIGIIVVVP